MSVVRVLIPIPQDISAPKRCSFSLLIYENILINADSWKTLSRLLLLCKFPSAPLHLKTVWVAPSLSLSLSLIIIIGFRSLCIYYWFSVAFVPLPFSFQFPFIDQHVNKLIRLTSPCIPCFAYCSRWGCQTRQLPDSDPYPEPRLDPNLVPDA